MSSSIACRDGSDSKQPRFIETRHRLGYRFAAPVAKPGAAPADKGAGDTSAIAVLPFADMSETRDQDYLCEGLAHFYEQVRRDMPAIRRRLGR